MMEKLLGTLKRGIPFVISAPAGTGKTTLAKMLVGEFPVISPSISCTTRPMRGGEVAGKDYHFLSQEAFEGAIERGEFLEYAEVFGYYYGTLRAHVEEKLLDRKHVLLIIDTQGALALRRGGYPAILIFVAPPSIGELRSRLMGRNTEKAEAIERRIAFAEQEMKMAVHYDYLITNDELHRAYEILRSILISEEHKMERVHGRIVN